MIEWIFYNFMIKWILIILLYAIGISLEIKERKMTFLFYSQNRSVLTT
jgi:hypothetical protein